MPRRWLVTTHGASKVGHANVPRLLLAHEAHPSASASDGFSAMLQSCGRGHRTLVTLLIDHGATVTLASEARLHFSCLASTAMLTSQRCFWSIGPMLPKKKWWFFPSPGGVWKRTRRCGSFAPSTDALRLTGRVTALRCAAIHSHREMAQLLVEEPHSSITRCVTS